ncbi:hypothetical protein BC831DRAFT_199699 [Entophlyctis helioformis]|nr:hypothetical protein BC831DRAFT_199699 [Entophlyctis helioformis]
MNVGHRAIVSWPLLALTMPIVGVRSMQSTLLPCIGQHPQEYCLSQIASPSGKPIDLFPIYAVMLVPHLFVGMSLFVSGVIPRLESSLLTPTASSDDLPVHAVRQEQQQQQQQQPSAQHQ